MTIAHRCRAQGSRSEGCGAWERVWLWARDRTRRLRPAASHSLRRGSVTRRCRRRYVAPQMLPPLPTELARSAGNDQLFTPGEPRNCEERLFFLSRRVDQAAERGHHHASASVRWAVGQGCGKIPPPYAGVAAFSRGASHGYPAVSRWLIQKKAPGAWTRAESRRCGLSGAAQARVFGWSSTSWPPSRPAAPLRTEWCRKSDHSVLYVMSLADPPAAVAPIAAVIALDSTQAGSVRSRGAALTAGLPVLAVMSPVARWPDYTSPAARVTAARLRPGRRQSRRRRPTWRR